MTGAHELPVVHIKIPCRDEREFQSRLAPHLGREGLFIPREPPLALGTRLLLRVQWTNGEIGVRGEAIVTQLAEPGSAPGMTVKLVTLDPQSARFALEAYPVAAPDLNRFGPWPETETVPAPVEAPGQLDLNGWPLPRMSAPLQASSREWDPSRSEPCEDFDAPETGPALQTAIGSLSPEAHTRVEAPAIELMRPAGAVKDQRPASSRVLFGKYWLLAPAAGSASFDAWVGSWAFVRAADALCVIKAARSEAGAMTVFGGALLERMRGLMTREHPNLAKVIELGEVSGRPFVTYEHLHGRPLTAILSRLRAVQVAPQVELAMFVGLAVARALEYLHGGALPVAHGAVSAANVFAGVEGEVRLEGLGLATPSSPSTPAELAADVYALGGLIHELLTLGLPPPGESSSGRHWHRAPSEWNRAIASSVDRLVLGATHVDPAQRTATSRSLRLGLEDELRRHGRWSLPATIIEMFGPELERERAEFTSLALAARKASAELDTKPRAIFSGA